MGLLCRPLDDAAIPAWDRFVDARPEATFFHRAGWRAVIERAFGHRAHYTFAERDGAIVGVLPLVDMRTRLFGRSLISAPFCVYGGPVAAEPEAMAALEAHAASLMDRMDVPATEFRFLHAPEGSGWTERSGLYVTFRRAIAGDDEANLKAIPRKQRAMVRKGIENGLRAEVSGRLGALHRVYAESVRNLGTPVFSRRYFALLLEAFPDASDVLTVFDGEAPIAAVMNFYFRDEVLPYYGGGTAAARGRAGNDFMYWEVMRHAAARGCRLFDFGRSKEGTGAFSFKKNWGFQPTPLAYRFRLRPGTDLPERNPLNPKYARFIAAWKRLPLPVANAIGPHLVRGLG
ncbi:MAG TPA: FemAB family XrtA/PEP-CTERM system-associated protein [Acetobacteraceae bacterium]|jgi:FemAB-related protein (PEP-CTERM system-associated)|nr:FemAB family XrtA/PEP-CTERM system-associated protein [Acetobacteraceae bacterium]